MPSPAPPRILGVIDGAPLDPATWSGSSRGLFRSLERRGALAGAVDAHVALLDTAARVASIAPGRRRWWQRYTGGAYALAGPLAAARTGLARRRAEHAGPAVDAVLQVGAWYDLTGLRGPRLRASYHDGNLATFLRRPDVALDSRSRSVRRALERERRLYERMDLILPMSEWLARAFVEDFGQDPAKVVAVGAGANIDELPAAPVRDAGSQESPRVLFVGKGEFARKGGPQLRDAFAELRRSHPAAELWLAGPAPAPDPRPGERWLGRIDRRTTAGERELRRLYTAATAFALPSLYEPFGIAFLEAMAYALPCLGANGCAMPEIVADGESGLLSEPGDVAALAANLGALADDPARAVAMGRAGRRRLEERYTWDAVGGRITAEIGARLEAA
ncbi:MAG: glycosyltransferase family 4 protein [Solirubrobacteraceae bacterium]